MVKHEEFWNDNHLFMIAQDKYMTVYITTQTERPLNYIVGGPSPKLRIATKSLTEQAHKMVFEEYSKVPPEDSSAAEYTAEDDADYWNNLDDVDLHNIENMMEG